MSDQQTQDQVDEKALRGEIRSTALEAFNYGFLVCGLTAGLILIMVHFAKGFWPIGLWPIAAGILVINAFAFGLREIGFRWWWPK